MKNVQLFILFTFLILSQNICAELENNRSESLIKPPYREYVASSFYAKFYQGFGIRNISWELDLNYQFRNYFSIGIGNGFNRNKTLIYSSSDKHMIKTWTYPLYLKANIFLVANSEKAFYIFGKYARAFGINTKNDTPNIDFKAVAAEAGLGYEKKGENRSIYFELGQYYATANGVYNSTYNSVITYDLKIYNLVAKIGFRFDL